MEKKLAIVFTESFYSDGLRAPPEVAFAMRSWPFLLLTFGQKQETYREEGKREREKVSDNGQYLSPEPKSLAPSIPYQEA